MTLPQASELPTVTRSESEERIPGFRAVPRTGVIYVMHRAAQMGWRRGGEDLGWANLGQGAPEAGPLEGAPPRRDRIEIQPEQQEYGPIGGIRELRQHVADYYNHFFRRGRASKYTADHVCIAGGGRAAMTRLAASLGEVNMGHFIPDYTAYEELLSTFKGFIPIPILLDRGHGYRATAEQLREEIVGRGLSALLCSNPCNPTGQLVHGGDLASWVQVARECRSTFLLDEFYSHYIYDLDPLPGGIPPMVSAAAYVDDVDRDPVILIDGLTKNWRYPGWRVSWIVGPPDVIERVTSAGSFLDGGANHPFQAQAVDLLEPDHVVQETRALQREFSAKRAYMLERLPELGIDVDLEPRGAFYVWGNLSRLPPPLNDGIRFFEAGLEEKVITVPGVFFDVNPGRRRVSARYQTYARLSFGPELKVLERGLDAIERIVRRR